MGSMTSLALGEGTTAWLRSSGLEIVLLILGAMLFGRFVSFVRDQITSQIDAGFRGGDALVRTEAAKHRHALAQANPIRASPIYNLKFFFIVFII